VIRLAIVMSLALAVTIPTTAAAQAPPPACAAGTPAALRFAGLPSRIPFGRNQLFSLDYDDYNWDVESAITVSMSRNGQTVFTRTTNDELAELHLRLDLGDKPTAVTATFQQSDSTVDGSACIRTIAATARGYRHFGIIDRCDAPSYRPRSIIIACGDGNFGLAHLRWRGWNRAVATARGKAYANDCVPYCAAGKFHQFRVRLRAYRPRRVGAGGYAYTRLRISYPGARPPGAPGVQVRKAAEDEFGGFFWR
jgi:hypothetical protein